MKSNNQIDYWNKVSKEKKFTTSLDIKLISKYISKDSLIIDYGCGYGRTLNELYSHGFKNSLGYDFAENMIEQGKVKFPFLNLKLSKNNKIEQKSNTADLIILFAVLTCIIDNSTQLTLINEIKRVLKPGGLLYINDFLINNDRRNTDRYEKFENTYETYGTFELSEGAVLRHHDKNWISKLTEEFDSETYKKIKFKTMNGHTSNGFIFIGRKR